MTKAAVVTARLDPSTLESLDRLAAEQDRSRAWLVGKAVTDYVREAEAFAAWLQEAEDQIDRGEYYTHEEMEAWFSERLAKGAP